MFLQFKLFSIFLCEQNIGLRDLQILGFCSYLHFNQFPNFFGAGFICPRPTFTAVGAELSQ